MVGGGRRPDQAGTACAGPSDPTNGSRRSEASNSELPRSPTRPKGGAAPKIQFISLQSKTQKPTLLLHSKKQPIQNFTNHKIAKQKKVVKLNHQMILFFM